jgi:hypothetical protein
VKRTSLIKNNCPYSLPVVRRKPLYIENHGIIILPTGYEISA